MHRSSTVSLAYPGHDIKGLHYRNEQHGTFNVSTGGFGDSVVIRGLVNGKPAMERLLKYPIPSSALVRL